MTAVLDDLRSQISKNATTIAISRWDMKCRLGVSIEDSGLSVELSGLRLASSLARKRLSARQPGSGLLARS
jgi:hypothetical protein